MTIETDNYNADLSSGIAAFDSKNFSLAYQLLSPLVNQGNREALFRVAMMQMNGLGMVENQPLALENFKSAAEQDHDFAHHMIGVAYLEGEGVEKDIDKAIVWFEKAANDYQLVGSMYVLAMLYEDGKQVEKDIEKAQFWYDKVAKIDKQNQAN